MFTPTSNSVPFEDDDDIISRPMFDNSKYFVEDGPTPGTITAVNRETRPSIYQEGSEWTLARLTIDVHICRGNVRKYFDVPLSWASKSKWSQTLAALGITVAPGEAFKLSSLINSPVIAHIENVERNGNSYSNVVAIEKPTTQPEQVVKTAKKRLLPTRTTTTRDIPTDTSEEDTTGSE